MKKPTNLLVRRFLKDLQSLKSLPYSAGIFLWAAIMSRINTTRSRDEFLEATKGWATCNNRRLLRRILRKAVKFSPLNAHELKILLLINERLENLPLRPKYHQG